MGEKEGEDEEEEQEEEDECEWIGSGEKIYSHVS